MTKRKGETSYKETTFGIIPRSELVPLKIAGIKNERQKILITFDIILLKEAHSHLNACQKGSNWLKLCYSPLVNPQSESGTCERPS